MKKIAQDRQPGTVSAKLRRQMGDAIADLFDGIGEKFYADAVLQVKQVLGDLFESSIGGLSTTVKEELGRRGLEESARHFHPFMGELVSDLVQYGMEDITAAVEDIASSMAAEYISEDPEEEAFEVGPEEVEVVEEVTEEEVEPAEEGAEEGAEEVAPGEVEELEELFGGEEEAEAEASNGDHRRRFRKRPSRRRVDAGRHRARAKRLLGQLDA